MNGLVPERATRFTKRLRGWMFKDVGDIDAPLLFPNCKAVHTFYMRFPIQVVFLDDKYQVVAHHRWVDVNQVVSGPPSTVHTLELTLGQDLERVQLVKEVSNHA